MRSDLEVLQGSRPLFPASSGLPLSEILANLERIAQRDSSDQQRPWGLKDPDTYIISQNKSPYNFEPYSFPGLQDKDLAIKELLEKIFQCRDQEMQDPSVKMYLDLLLLGLSVSFSYPPNTVIGRIYPTLVIERNGHSFFFADDSQDRFMYHALSLSYQDNEEESQQRSAFMSAIYFALGVPCDTAYILAGSPPANNELNLITQSNRFVIEEMAHQDLKMYRIMQRINELARNEYDILLAEDCFKVFTFFYLTLPMSYEEKDCYKKIASEIFQQNFVNNDGSTLQYSIKKGQDILNLFRTLIPEEARPEMTNIENNIDFLASLELLKDAFNKSRHPSSTIVADSSVSSSFRGSEI